MSSRGQRSTHVGFCLIKAFAILIPRSVQEVNLLSLFAIFLVVVAVLMSLVYIILFQLWLNPFDMKLDDCHIQKHLKPKRFLLK